MPAWLVLLSMLTIAASTATAGQTVPDTDGVERLLAQLETLLRTRNPDGFAALTDSRASPEQIQQFAADVFRPDTVRAIVNERDRSPLEGAAPGTGYRLVVEMFAETAGRARILTTLLYALKRHNGQRGIACLCLGGGEAVAMAVEME